MVDISIDFNRLDKLVRIDDPRMSSLDKDAVFERSKVGHDRIKFLRNGVDAKFELIYDDQRWVFRPLSIQEEHDCEILAGEDLYKLAEHLRTNVYLQYRIMIHKLAKALCSCPDAVNDIKLTIIQLECIPSSYLVGLNNQYDKLMMDLNTDLDKISNEDLHSIINLVTNDPKLLSNCSVKQLQLMVLELLRTNITLRGN